MAIAPPNFTDRNPQTIEDDTVARATEALQRDRIYDGEPLRLFLAVMAYRETLVRTAIQFAGEQNLVSYAGNQYLDLIGEAFDAPRLTESPAVTTIRFTKDADATAFVAFVPAGTRVETSDGAIIFATDADLTIASGVGSDTVQATANISGIIGNGYQVGEVASIIDPASFVASATNISITNGGADIESDEAYRIRLKLAPSKFSVAGPDAAYEFWARSADSDVLDVAIIGPPTTARVHVNVYVLADGPSLPTTELLTTVDAALQDDQLRPLTDIVTVLAPTEVNYTIDASVILLVDADTASVTAALQAAADEYTADRRDGLGRDIVRSQIIGALALVEGVYDVTLTEPATDTVIASSEWANATSVTVNIVGTSEG